MRLSGRGGDWALSALLVAVLLFLPLGMAFARHGAHVIFNLFSGDAMYYLAVANNTLQFGFPTFNGAEATNGFHPLWQWLLTALLRLSAVSHHDQLYVSLIASAALVYAAYAMLSALLLRLLGRAAGALATLALFPGCFELAFAPTHMLYNGITYAMTPYSAVNGMETPLSLALWAGFALVLHARMHRMPLAQALAYAPLGLLLAAIVLARLDDVILAAALCLLLLAQRGKSMERRVLACVKLCWPMAAALVLYMLCNLETVGAALPVSAMEKTQFQLWNNLAKLEQVVFNLSYAKDWHVKALRIYPLFFSLLAGLALLLTARRAKGAVKPWAALLGLYCTLKAGFYLVAVSVFDQGYWYYMPMVTAANAFFALWLAAAAKRSNALAPAAALLAAVFVFQSPRMTQMMNGETDSRHMVLNSIGTGGLGYALWQQGGQIRAFLKREAPQAVLLESLDGLYAWSLNLPAISTTALMASPVEIRRRRQGGFSALLNGREALLPEKGYYLNLRNLPEDWQVVRKLNPPGLPLGFYLVKQKEVTTETR